MEPRQLARFLPFSLFCSRRNQDFQETKQNTSYSCKYEYITIFSKGYDNTSWHYEVCIGLNVDRM